MNSINDTVTAMEILEAFREYAEQLNERFDRIEQRLDRIEERLDKIEHTLRYHETWLRKIEETMATKTQFNALLFTLEHKSLLNRYEIEHIQAQ